MGDIELFVGYRTGLAMTHVRVCPLETPRFGFGLELANAFVDRGAADEYARAIQQYLDSWKASVIADAVRHHESPYMKRANSLGEGWVIISGIGQRMAVLETEAACDRVMQFLTGEAGPFAPEQYYGHDPYQTEDEEEVE